MADISFEITDGPYAGRYDIEAQDFTATEMGKFREALGHPMTAVFAGVDGVGLEDLAGMVWLMRRRASKGLPYEAVADTITFRNFEQVADEPELKPGDPIPPEG